MWYAKTYGGYARDSTEAHSNANEIALALYGNNWCKESVCALLGNGAGESGLNPWRWESNDIPTVAQFEAWTDQEARLHGYGIFQFTPAKKYINSTNQSIYANAGYAPNFADSAGNANDGRAQTLFFMNSVSSDWLHELYNYYYDDFIGIGVDITPWYYTTFDNFKNGVDNNGNPLTLDELVGVFELSYERPGDTYAASSYSARCDSASYWYSQINPPSPGYNFSKMPWIYYLKRRRY